MEASVLSYGGRQNPITGTKALHGVGILFDQKIVPPDKVHVKVVLLVWDKSCDFKYSHHWEVM